LIIFVSLPIIELHLIIHFQMAGSAM